MPQRQQSALFPIEHANLLSLVAIGVGVFFLWPYFLLILVGLILAYLFNPLYQRCRRKFGVAVSLALTSLALLLILSLPVLVLVLAAIDQALEIVDRIAVEGLIIDGRSVDIYVGDVVLRVNSWAQDIFGAAPPINETSVANFVKETLPTLLQRAANSFGRVVSDIPIFFTNLILFMFVFTGALVNQDKLLKTLRGLSPFNSKTSQLYALRAREMTKAMVKGQFVIAFLQGLAGALSLTVLGLGNSIFVLMLFVFSLLNLVPLGSGIIIIPLGILMMLFGNVWAGLFILGVHFVIVTNIDNVLRPLLVSKEARLPAALLMLSVFAGIHYFGLFGIIVGPVLMILITTTLEVTSKQYKP